MNEIKVLVVDDSALMRKIISDMINRQDDMQVIGTARNGEDLFEKLLKLKPDVITLDVEMPKMDGMTALKKMQEMYVNIPVIMLSSVSNKGPQLTMDCLEAGAFDFLPKPSGEISLDIDKVKDELVEKIRLTVNRSVRISNSAQKATNDNEINNVMSSFNRENSTNSAILKDTIKSNKIDAVVIGASTGGPKALYSVITAFPEKVGIPIFVVQHMPVGFTKAFAERLNSNSSIKVVEAKDSEEINIDTVYIAPGGFHMEIGNDKRIHLNTEPPLWGVRPSVDKLFKSASKVYGSGVLSVVLTGMGRDGADGTTEVKKNGGVTLSQDKATCTIYGMPKAAYYTGMVDIVLPLDNVTEQIIQIVDKRR